MTLQLSEPLFGILNHSYTGISIRPDVKYQLHLLAGSIIMTQILSSFPT